MNEKIGIIGALPEEIAMLERNVQVEKVHRHNQFLSFYEGELHGREVVYAASNVGQNFASSVATTLINVYNARKAILFSGVAGGLIPGQRIGDIIVATDTINYDIDVSAYRLPWDPEYRHRRGELPFVKLREFRCDNRLHKWALETSVDPAIRLYAGRVVSGSEFLTSARKNELQPLWEELGNPAAVEMEGAAVGQVCHVYAVPFLLVRALSDTLEGDVTADFNAFAEQVAASVWPIVEHIVRKA